MDLAYEFPLMQQLQGGGFHLSGGESQDFYTTVLKNIHH